MHNPELLGSTVQNLIFAFTSTCLFLSVCVEFISGFSLNISETVLYLDNDLARVGIIKQANC